MSLRTIEREPASGDWDRAQAADLVNGTVGIAACFALVCVFLIAMSY